MPRPKLNRQRVNITLPTEQLARLDAHAKAKGKTRSDVIENAVEAHLPPKTIKRPRT